jgi:hypothetical protein
MIVSALNSLFFHLTGCQWDRFAVWNYFPAAFFLKTPVSLILLLLGGLVLLVARRRQLGLFNEAFVVLPILVYLSFAMAIGVNS